MAGDEEAETAACPAPGDDTAGTSSASTLEEEPDESGPAAAALEMEPREDEVVDEPAPPSLNDIICDGTSQNGIGQGGEGAGQGAAIPEQIPVLSIPIPTISPAVSPSKEEIIATQDGDVDHNFKFNGTSSTSTAINASSTIDGYARNASSSSTTSASEVAGASLAHIGEKFLDSVAYKRPFSIH